VGDTKLRALFAVEADPKKWNGVFSSAAAPPGWTDATLSGFLAEFPKYEAWRHAELPFVEYPKVAAAGSGPRTTAEAIRSGKGLAAASAAAAASTSLSAICFTGFRDKELEAAAAAAGYTVAAAITSKVTVLVVPDGPVRESEKVKAARTKGIKIMAREEFAAQLQ
jgi:hypothetical protein